MAQALKLIQSHFEALNKRIDAINEKLNRVSVLIDGWLVWVWIRTYFDQKLHDIKCHYRRMAQYFFPTAVRPTDVTFQPAFNGSFYVVSRYVASSRESTHLDKFLVAFRILSATLNEKITTFTFLFYYVAFGIKKIDVCRKLGDYIRGSLLVISKSSLWVHRICICDCESRSNLSFKHIMCAYQFLQGFWKASLLVEI